MAAGGGHRVVLLTTLLPVILAVTVLPYVLTAGEVVVVDEPVVLANAGETEQQCDATNYSFKDGLALCVCRKLRGQTFCACQCDKCGGFGLTGCEQCDESSGVCSGCNCIRPNPPRANDGTTDLNRAEPECHESGFEQTDMSSCRCNNRGGLTICACLCTTCPSLPVQACMECDEETCSSCRCGGTGFGGRFDEDLLDGFEQETQLKQLTNSNR
eukprot:GHVS01079346.1.p1 GENE.GHVS01079346.1~~GHVS01079346.1.p1  ORF type:complete len:214 (+),score=42.10 GHVS01079346.1:183-824(+)